MRALHPHECKIVEWEHMGICYEMTVFWRKDLWHVLHYEIWQNSPGKPVRLVYFLFNKLFFYYEVFPYTIISPIQLRQVFQNIGYPTGADR